MELVSNAEVQDQSPLFVEYGILEGKLDFKYGRSKSYLISAYKKYFG